MFRSPDHLDKFKNYLNSKRRNIRFTCEKGHNISMLFLEVLITLNVFNCSDFSRFHSEVCHLKEILKKNAFPIKLIDSCIKNFLNKRFTEKHVTLTAEKKDLVIVLSFLGKLPLDLRTHLRNSISKNLPFVKFLNHQHVCPIFSSSKIKCPIACTLTSFTNFRVVDTGLPITAKHAGI